MLLLQLTQTELVLLVFLRLDEDVVMFQNIPAQRRREIQQGLTANMAELYSYFITTLQTSYNAYTQLVGVCDYNHISSLYVELFLPASWVLNCQVSSTTDCNVFMFSIIYPSTAVCVNKPPLNCQCKVCVACNNHRGLLQTTASSYVTIMKYLL